MPFISSIPDNPDESHKMQMNSPGPTSPLFLPFNQLSPHCSKLLRLLNDDRETSKMELIAQEQILWKEVKKLRALQDKANIFTYLVGYYTTLIQFIKSDDSDDIFQYHILIRLGDLNRYLERSETAEYYYCNARNLFPNYGHAYNQLGLLTKRGNIYKRCYYYARAAKSIKRPLEKNLAESNLRMVIRENENSILDIISNGETCTNIKSPSNFEAKPDLELSFPETAFEWFYLAVVAIYFDNIQPLAKPFMRFVGDNFSTQRSTILKDGVEMTSINCDRDSYLLLATLDVLLDWSKHGGQGRAICQAISSELKQIRTSLNSAISSLRSNRNQNSLIHRSNIPNLSPLQGRVNTISQDRCPGNSTPLSPASINTLDTSSPQSMSASESTTASLKLHALPHDCVLRGFKPLEIVHNDLQFPRDLPIFNGLNGKLDEFGDVEHLQEGGFIGPEQMMQILVRIKSKIDSLSPMMKRQTRNIALESILSSISSCDP